MLRPGETEAPPCSRPAPSGRGGRVISRHTATERRGYKEARCCGPVKPRLRLVATPLRRGAGGRVISRHTATERRGDKEACAGAHFAFGQPPRSGGPWCRPAPSGRGGTRDLTPHGDGAPGRQGGAGATKAALRSWRQGAQGDSRPPHLGILPSARVIVFPSSERTHFPAPSRRYLTTSLPFDVTVIFVSSTVRSPQE